MVLKRVPDDVEKQLFSAEALMRTASIYVYVQYTPICMQMYGCVAVELRIEIAERRGEFKYLKMF